ncbi:MAG: serine/threonine-protein kinase [Planctomycetota bacterium]
MPENVPDGPADAPPGGGPAPSSPPRPGRPSGIIGHTLKGYRVLAKIGEGGMGAVFRSLDEGLDREVAIKVLPPSLAREESFRTRFLREARALARVRHPNLVQIYTVAADKGLHFFAMEYVRGKTLAARIARGPPVAREEIIAIGGQVLAAIAAVHAAGVTHRDVKTANIMLEDGGRAVLMDLGLAKDEASRGVTTEGMILGTPEYMPPEQAHGEPATARSDIYSFGVVLFEMAAGRVPFTGKSAIAVLRKQCEEEPPDLGELRPDLGPELCEAVRAAMSKDPDERPGDASELAGLLLKAGRTPELEALAGGVVGGVVSGAMTQPALGHANAPTLLEDGSAAPPAPRGGKGAKSPWRKIIVAAIVAILLGVVLGRRRGGRKRKAGGEGPEGRPAAGADETSPARRKVRVYVAGDDMAWTGYLVGVGPKGIEIELEDGTRRPIPFSSHPEIRYIDEPDDKPDGDPGDALDKAPGPRPE